MTLQLVSAFTWASKWFPPRFKRPTVTSDKRIQISTWRNEKWSLFRRSSGKKKKEEEQNASSQKLTGQVEGINILHQTHLRKSSQTNRFKELFHCWVPGIIQVMTPFRHLTLLKRIMLPSAPTTPQHGNLPVRLRADPLFVFCSLKLPFILSPSFISSVSCRSLTAHYNYQAVPRWEASTGWRGGEKWGRGNEELQRERKVDEFLVVCCLFSENELSPLFLSFPLFVSLHLDNGYLTSVTYQWSLSIHKVFQHVSSIFSPVLSYFNPPRSLHSFRIVCFYIYTPPETQMSYMEANANMPCSAHTRQEAQMPASHQESETFSSFSAQRVQASECATRILAKGLERRMEQRD